MSDVSTDLRAEVILARGLHSDAGPCDGIACGQRSTWRVELLVQGIHATVYVCDHHADEFGIDPALSS